MWRTGLMFSVVGLLAGCGANANLAGNNQTVGIALRAASVNPAVPAWGERLAITDNRARTLRVNDPSGPRTLPLASIPALVDLPGPPLSTETWGAASSVSLGTYKTRLDPAVYTRRAAVDVLDASGNVLSRFYPHGSVEVGQLEFLVSAPVQGCASVFSSVNARLTATGIPGFTINAEDRFSVTLPGKFDLCQGVVQVGQQNTQTALTRLDTALSLSSPRLPIINDAGYVSDKLTVMGLMQAKGALDYDPTCNEVQQKLDPIASNGFGTVSMTKLGSDLNTATTALRGTGVRVAVIGGGMGVQDQFDCRPGYPFAKHDTYIGDLIRTLAPNVTQSDYPVCSAAGSCPSSLVSRALMQVLAASPAPQLVNLSLGGPLPNKVMFELLEQLGLTNGTQVITSSGNTPSAPAQYPASYARGVAQAGEPTLNNVVSVAALGWKGGSYQIAAFNTRQNANVFAPGVSLCPTIILGQRCLTQPYPQNLGISGTSFAAPIVTALSALLIEQTGRMPQDLLGCLNRNLKTDPASKLTYPAVMGQACL